MAVNLKTVKDTVNLAAGVLAAAAGVVDGAKQLGFDVDGAVKSAADGATNGARAVADGIGKGFGAAAEGVGDALLLGPQLARWGMPRRRSRTQGPPRRLARRSMTPGNQYLKARRR
jgi:hypothetical protein